MSRPVTCVLSRESRPCRYRQRRLGLIGVPPCASMRILAAYRGREQVPAERDGGGFRLSEWFLVPQSPESVHSMHRRWLEGILTSRGPSGPGLWPLGSGLWGSPGGRLCEAGLHSGGGHAVAAEAAAEQHWQPVAELSSRVAQSWDLWLMSQGRVSILQQL